MKKRTGALFMIIALMLFSVGCVSAISKELRAQVDEGITVHYALNAPESSMDKTVMWGGVIVDAKNLKQGTLLEIVQKPISFEGRPRRVDQSEGRFLALYEGFLDVAIYSSGREVTVAGRLTELRREPLGEIEYTYPVVAAKELYLWPKRVEKKYYYYPYWYGPGPYRYHSRFPRDPWYW